MPSLLDLVLEANGAARFASVSKITAKVEFGGTFWEVKGHPMFAGAAIVEARAQEQWIRQINVVGGQQMLFDKSRDRVTVLERNEDVIEELQNPRRTFGGYTQRPPWSVGVNGRHVCGRLGGGRRCA